MSYNFAGNPEIQELPRGIRLGKEGVRTVLRYRGRYQDLVGLIPLVRGANKSNEVELQPDGDDSAFATLTVTTAETVDGSEDAGEKVLNLLWSRSGNTLEKDIYSTPGLTFDGADVLRAAIKKYDDLTSKSTETGQTIKDAIKVPKIGTVNAAQTALVKDIFNEYVLGTQAYQIGQTVLKRSATLPANYKKKWPSSNELKQFTLAQLKTWELLKPEELPFEIPTTGVWVKMPSNIDRQRDGTYTVDSQFYHLDSASLRYYPAAVAPTDPPPEIQE